MTAIPIPIPPITITDNVVHWDELIRWIIDQLSSIPFDSAPIPDSWKVLIACLVSELEASFSIPQSPVDNEKWEMNFRDANAKAKKTLDAGAERVIDHIREMPRAARPRTAVWWKVAWEKIVMFFTKLVDAMCGVGHTMWERVKAWFARIRQAIVRAWSAYSGSGQGWGQNPLKC